MWQVHCWGGGVAWEREKTVNINLTAEKLDDIGAELKDMPQNNFMPIGSSEWSVKLKLTQQ
jgi:hypothetical protein